MLTPIDSNIHEEKEVIFQFENIFAKTLINKIEIINDEFIIGMAFYGSLSLINCNTLQSLDSLNYHDLR